MYTKAMQLGKPKKKTTRNFTPKVKEEIFERDNYRCIKCGSYRVENVPHHIHYKSQGGIGEKQNGATVCPYCHDWAHHKRNSVFGEPSKEGKEWFESWRDANLDANGDMKI
ncbi:HNH endonuclease [Virgibacillus sp. CBA3643]|uniref:HNH endonuclease n=1 Tax=Virgibacillus sp. CBA3643 TaxID=2942278 RepID=UPI0035A370EB